MMEIFDRSNTMTLKKCWSFMNIKGSEVGISTINMYRQRSETGIPRTRTQKSIESIGFARDL